MKRRQALAALLALAATPSRAQALKEARVGVLFLTRQSDMSSQIDALRVGMRELGYVEGKNLHFEMRSAEGAPDRLPALAAQLVRFDVNVIAAFGTPAALAAKRTTTTVPIVMMAVGDPVSSGLVASLARPGGNVTGSSLASPQIVAKRLELLKEAQPHLRRIALLHNPANPAQKLSVDSATAAAAALNVEVQSFEARNLEEIVKAFSAMPDQRIEAVVIANDLSFTTNASAIAALANERRLPTAAFGELARAGVLIGYGSFTEVYRYSARFVVAIIKGAKPADMPVEQPSKFEVILNARTAKVLGLDIPASFYSRADRVIE